MRTRTLLVAVGSLSIAITQPALAQHAEDDLHIDHHHTRHTHAHGDKHPERADQSRFFTSRSSGVTLPLPNEEDAFFFVVYGDRTGGPDEGVSILKDAVRDTNLIEPDFVLTVGDLIQGYSTAGPWMAQMTEYKGIMDELLCPWFPVAGNHDVYWRGEGRPAGEHESNYEMHFGPLWYAFEHKNCMFIVLYSDEGNPETGAKSFREPANQRMSDEQFDWLKSMLELGSDAEHIFISLHHPRWLRGGYGDDWDKVHAELVDAGNVSAVFAGHIHKMRYDPKDGIDYIALATVGGHQGGAVPEAGMLHHYNIVTVRRDQVAHAAVPVGEMMDVREITGAMAYQAEQLSRVSPAFDRSVPLGMDGAADETVTVTLSNPTSFDADLALFPESLDSRWAAWPDHAHGTLKAGESRAFPFRFTRVSDELDASFRPIDIAVRMEMLLPGARYTVPESRHEIPLDARLSAPARPAHESVLRLDGRDDALRIASDALALPDGPMTLECWFRADRFTARTGLVAKTESSEFGFFISDGKPQFSIHLGGKYRTAGSHAPLLTAGRWHHLAGVYDGAEIRVYLDGQLVDAVPGSGARTPNTLPLMIGADVDRHGNAMSPVDGEIDEVRISSIARYDGSAFSPAPRHTADRETVLLLHMDGAIGRWIIDSGPKAIRGTLLGGATAGTKTE